MIGTMMRLGWTNLKRDRAALFLTFLVPLVFFSIFAAIFGNLGGGGEDGGIKDLQVLAVDEDGSSISASLIATLGEQEGLEVIPAPPATEERPQPEPWSRDAAFREVRAGRAAAAIVVPAGFGEQFADFGQDGLAVELIYDASNPMAQFTVAGLLQAAAFQAAPTALMEGGFEALEEFGGGALTEQQRASIEQLRVLLEEGPVTDLAGDDDAGFSGLVQVEATAAHDDEDGEDFSMVAYYAAGIGVMFLLFSMTGAAGSLLDEQESGTLDRLLTSNLGMSQLLVGKWAFYALIGLAQVLLMFGWGAAVFGLDLSGAKTLVGLLAVAVPTAAAASAFGLLLATLCTSRAQLGGLSTIVVLVMSALGGSMVPRFVMPDFMDTLSKFTFNGWALDGFLKVFWYDDPEASVVAALRDLAPQILVLSVACVVFLVVARRLAGRWERV